MWRVTVSDRVFDMKDKTHRQTTTRALNAAGFAHIKPGWVREGDFVKLQAQIDRAVESAAAEVEQIRDGCKPESQR